jgi:hypothetical protein
MRVRGCGDSIVTALHEASHLEFVVKVLRRRGIRDLGTLNRIDHRVGGLAEVERRVPFRIVSHLNRCRQTTKSVAHGVDQCQKCQK